MRVRVDKLDLLESLGFYRDAPPDLRSRMRAVARDVRLAAGDLLFREGEPAGHFAVVGSGRLRVFRTGATGRQITLYHVRRHESSLVGMLSVLLGGPSVASAQAEVESQILIMPGGALREWTSGSEAVRRFVFETTTRALIDVTALIEDVAFRTIEGRLAALIVQHVDASNEIRMRHEDIAAEIGTAREVISRLLEGFERSGTIVLARGRIRVRNPAPLQVLASRSE